MQTVYRSGWLKTSLKVIRLIIAFLAIPQIWLPEISLYEVFVK